MLLGERPVLKLPGLTTGCSSDAQRCFQHVRSMSQHVPKPSSRSEQYSAPLAWLFEAPGLVRSNRGDSGRPSARSRSPCRKNSSSRRSTQQQCTCYRGQGSVQAAQQQHQLGARSTNLLRDPFVESPAPVFTNAAELVHSCCIASSACIAHL